VLFFAGVAAVAVVVLAVVLTGGGDGASPGATPEGAREDPDAPGGVAAEPDANGNLPEDVVANYFEASSTADCELYRESVTEEWWLEAAGASSEEEAMGQCEARLSSEGQGMTLESAELAGIVLEPSADQQAQGMEPGTAVVEIVVNGHRDNMWLIMDDGLWKALPPE
jgi:hypothetical protein